VTETTSDTAPCSDCGQLVDYINDPWYAIDSGGLCVPCGKARGLSDEYLMAQLSPDAAPSAP
jgi:hypothetical protein